MKLKDTKTIETERLLLREFDSLCHIKKDWKQKKKKIKIF
jgi:hypothetical protein